jgi:hypothetical protein
VSATTSTVMDRRLTAPKTPHARSTARSASGAMGEGTTPTMATAHARIPSSDTPSSTAGTSGAARNAPSDARAAASSRASITTANGLTGRARRAARSSNATASTSYPSGSRLWRNRSATRGDAVTNLGVRRASIVRATAVATNDSSPTP